MDGIEIYTKKGISQLYPDLECFMNRDKEKIFKNLNVLNKYRDQILEKMKVRFLGNVT